MSVRWNSIQRPVVSAAVKAQEILNRVAGLAQSAVDKAAGVVPTLDLGDLPDSIQVPAPIQLLSNVDIQLAVSTLQELRDQLMAARPEYSFDYTDEEYSSYVLSLLQAKVAYDLEHGTSGIDPEQEEALFQRARDREMRVALAAVENAALPYVISGLTMPPGAMLAAMQVKSDEANDRIIAASREIMIEREKLYVAGRNATFVAATSLEQINSALYTATMARSLDAAKARLQAVIDIFTAEAKGVEAIADVYAKTFAAEGEIIQARAKAYEAEVAATLGAANYALDRVVKIAGIQIDSAKSQANVYAAIASSALGAMNINASLSQSESYSSSESDATSSSYQQSDSDSKAESRSYDMTKGTETNAYSRVDNHTYTEY